MSKKDEEALRKFSMVFTGTGGIMLTFIVALIAFFATSNNTYRMIAIGLPMILTIIAVIRLSMAPLSDFKKK